MDMFPAHSSALETGAAPPRHIGILNDYVRIPYANGSSFASQFLYREFTRRGHEVTVLGPRDPRAGCAEMPRRSVLFDSVPLRNHPGLFLALPSSQALDRALTSDLDVILAQTGSGLLDFGVWLRAKAGVPLVCVNTIHLPSVYNTILPDSLNERADVTEFFHDGLIPKIEQLTVQAYNFSDGLVVLSHGLKRYWSERGVRVPIHVIARAVDPEIFDAPGGTDPFPASCAKGHRLLCVCRHAREKNVGRLIEIFAHRISPRSPLATLTLVGDGPDHETYVELARRLGVSERVHFLGEFPVTQVARFYRHADAFVYTSLSETYGQVVSEAAWSGLPVVAFNDDKGVADQVVHGRTGSLIEPGPDTDTADAEFARAVLALLDSDSRRRAIGEAARQRARQLCAPELCLSRYYDVFRCARQHCVENWRPQSLPSRAVPLARWAALHTVLAGLGHVRSPALLNRHGRKQPGWELQASAA